MTRVYNLAMSSLRINSRMGAAAVWLFVFTAALLTGCQKALETPAASPTPTKTRQVMPTLIQASATQTIPFLPTAAATQPAPTETSLPAWVTVAAPTETPEGYGTPDPAAQGTEDASSDQQRTIYPTFTPPPPSAQLNIQRPGPNSMVISPILMRAVIHPGDDKMVYLELIGEDGRLITSQNYNFSLARDYWIYTVQEIPFTIDAFSEAARLVLYTLDRFNRTMYLTSVDLILLQLGDNSINVPVIEDEPYLIRKPWEGTTIRGGVMEVEGLIRPVSSQPLIIEIIDEEGNIVGSGEADFDQPSELQPYVPFKTTVSYSVSKWTRARFSARQESSSRIPGTVWLTSFLLYLEP